MKPDATLFGRMEVGVEEANKAIVTAALQVASMDIRKETQTAKTNNVETKPAHENVWLSGWNVRQPRKITRNKWNQTISGSRRRILKKINKNVSNDNCIIMELEVWKSIPRLSIPTGVPQVKNFEFQFGGEGIKEK